MLISLLLVFISILVASFLYYVTRSTKNHTCKNVELRGVNLKNVVLSKNDSLRNFYIVQFDIHYVNDVETGSVLEAGFDGIDYPIDNVIILDSKGEDITENFKGRNCYDCQLSCYDNLPITRLSHLNIKSMIKNINSKEVSGFILGQPQLFCLSGNSKPSKIILMYKNKKIENIVEEKPLHFLNVTYTPKPQ